MKLTFWYIKVSLFWFQITSQHFYGLLRLVTHQQHMHSHTASSAELLLLHLFSGLFSTTTWVSRYQKGKTSLNPDRQPHQHLITQFFIGLSLNQQCQRSYINYINVLHEQKKLSKYSAPNMTSIFPSITDVILKFIQRWINFYYLFTGNEHILSELGLNSSGDLLNSVEMHLTLRHSAPCCRLWGTSALSSSSKQLFFGFSGDLPTESASWHILTGTGDSRCLTNGATAL